MRHVDKFVERWEQEWPVERTRWTKFYLHSHGRDSANEGGPGAQPGAEDVQLVGQPE